MSFADTVLKSNLNKVLSEGKSDKGQKIRPKWSDETPAYTLKCFGVLNEYDLKKNFLLLLYGQQLSNQE